MVRTQVQLTEEQATGLRQLAHKRHVSIAELVRESVDQLLRHDGGNSGAECRKRAAQVAGRFRSGGLPLSDQHDRYLAEAEEK